MATSKSSRHIHKYQNRTVGFKKLWVCCLPTCSHHMPEHLSDLVEGRASICWKCNEPFVLNVINMGSDKPICEDCSPMADINELLKNREIM